MNFKMSVWIKTGTYITAESLWMSAQKCWYLNVVYDVRWQ